MTNAKLEKSEVEEVLDELGSLEAVNRYYEVKRFRERMAEHDRVSRIAGAKEEGRLQAALEIAKRMIDNGMPVEKIIEFTSLTMDKINSLK